MPIIHRPDLPCAKCKEAEREISSYCYSCHNLMTRVYNEKHLGPRWRRYGLRKSDVECMREEQGNCCAICGDSFETVIEHVDHDHRAGGGVRGLLCSSCNQGLGNFKDDVDRLQAAVVYLLERSQA